MRVLFFIVHPSKFHLFKNSFEILKKQDIKFDIIISNKEVLSELLISGGYQFIDIFPNGRRISFLPNKLNAFVNLFRTLWRLFLATRNKKYDVFVTDDVLTIFGKIKKTPSIAFTDNDLSTVPLVKLIFRAADKILAPQSTCLDDLTYKKISFKGNKAIAHLHPKYFKKNEAIVEKYNLQGHKIFIIRLAKLNANHDSHGNPGITDTDLNDLINIIPNDYRIIICSERKLPKKFEHLLLKIAPIDFTQVLAFSSFFFGDSSTMATEAAILGIPNILINNIAKKLNVLKELDEVYHIHTYFDSFQDARMTFESMTKNNSLLAEYKKNAAIFINDCDDFNQIFVDELINYKK